MSKKILMGLAPMLAVVAFAVAPAVATATSPHWYVNNVKLPETGAKTAVKTHGHLKLEDGAKFSEGNCKDAGNIWNPTGGGAGEDEITEFKCIENTSNICPEGTVTEVEKVPGTAAWPTKLTEPNPGEFRDETTGIKIEIRCSGGKAAEYTGSLEPKFVNSNPSFVEFNESGFLTNTATATKGFITGNDSVEGVSGQKITVKNP